MTSESFPPYDFLRIEIDHGIATVTLNRPNKHNALHVELLTELIEISQRISKDRSIRVVILTAEGIDFSSGLDFSSVLAKPRRLLSLFLSHPCRGANSFQHVTLAWRDVPVPVIAAITGRCWGAGLQLALAADYRFATPDANFSIMEGKWGLVPDMGALVTLPELVGIDVAKKLSMTAELFSGIKAKEYGIVSELNENPLHAAQELAQQLIKQSPDQLAAVKSLFHQAWFSKHRRTLRLERHAQLRLGTRKNTRIVFKTGGKPEPQNFIPRRRFP